MKNRKNKNLKLGPDEFIDDRTPGIIYVLKVCGVEQYFKSLKRIKI